MDADLRRSEEQCDGDQVINRAVLIDENVHGSWLAMAGERESDHRDERQGVTPEHAREYTARPSLIDVPRTFADRSTVWLRQR
jgi:hypothetical protein